VAGRIFLASVGMFRRDRPPDRTRGGDMSRVPPLDFDVLSPEQRGLYDEIAVLTIARHWSADYEWFAREKNALKAGLPASVIATIRRGRCPEFATDDQKLVYEIICELNATKRLGAATYERAVASLGLEKMIELVSVAGFYTTAAMMINVFEVPVPGGARPFADAD
jgi:hypothetical protein